MSGHNNNAPAGYTGYALSKDDMIEEVPRSTLSAEKLQLFMQRTQTAGTSSDALPDCSSKRRNGDLGGGSSSSYMSSRLPASLKEITLDSVLDEMQVYICVCACAIRASLSN